MQAGFLLHAYWREGGKIGSAREQQSQVGALQEPSLGGEANLLKPSRSKDPLVQGRNVAFPHNSPVRSVGLKTAPALGLPLFPLASFEG